MSPFQVAAASVANCLIELTEVCTYGLGNGRQKLALLAFTLLGGLRYLSHVLFVDVIRVKFLDFKARPRTTLIVVSNLFRYG